MSSMVLLWFQEDSVDPPDDGQMGNLSELLLLLFKGLWDLLQLKPGQKHLAGCVTGYCCSGSSRWWVSVFHL